VRKIPAITYTVRLEPIYKDINALSHIVIMGIFEEEIGETLDYIQNMVAFWNKATDGKVIGGNVQIYDNDLLSIFSKKRVGET